MNCFRETERGTMVASEGAEEARANKRNLGDLVLSRHSSVACCSKPYLLCKRRFYNPLKPVLGFLLGLSDP